MEHLLNLMFYSRRIQTSRNRQSSTFSSAPSPRRILVLEITQVTPNNIDIPNLRKSLIKSQTQPKRFSRVTSNQKSSSRTPTSNIVVTREKPQRTRQRSRSQKRTSRKNKPQITTTTTTTAIVRRKPTTTTRSKSTRCQFLHFYGDCAKRLDRFTCNIIFFH